MTRFRGKAGPVPDNGTVDGAPGGRRVLSPEDSRVSPDARRVRTTPAKRVSPALWRPPGAPFPAFLRGNPPGPLGETEKGKPACPAPSKNRDGGALAFLIPPLKGEGGERGEPGGV